jgi:O-antigen ligase
MQLKLPFLFLPLAFAGNWQLQEKQWKFMTYSFLLFVVVSCCRSLWQYFQNIAAINESYLRAKSLPTTFDDDHVRFSGLVSIAVVCGTLLIRMSKNKKNKIIIDFIAAALSELPACLICKNRTCVSLFFLLVFRFVFSFIAATTLEIQFGIFIYCFTILLWWKWLKLQKE